MHRLALPGLGLELGLLDSMRPLSTLRLLIHGLDSSWSCNKQSLVAHHSNILVSIACAPGLKGYAYVILLVHGVGQRS